MKEVISKCRALLAGALFTVLVTTAGCVATSAPTAPQPNETDIAFSRIAERFLGEVLALSPVNATALGDHRYDAMLDDVSAAGFTRRATAAHHLLEQLEPLNLQRLSRANQVDAHLLRNELEYEIWSIEQLKEWRWNPLLYTDLAGASVDQLMAREFAPLQQRLHNVGARLSELPAMLVQVRESLDPASVPRIHAETAVKQNSGILSLIDQLIVPQLQSLSEGEQTEIKAAIGAARTAVAQHQIWLEKKLLPAAKGNFRLGAQLYDMKLHFALDSNLTRQEIRSRADTELARARAEMYTIAKTQLANRPDAPPLPDNPDPEQQQAAIVAALDLAYAQRPDRDKVFETAQRAVEEARAFVRSHDLVTLYDDPLEIIPMPEFKRGVALAYCDPPGPLDRGQKTFYVIAPIPKDWNDAQVNSYLREYNTRSIYNMTIHEAMPGHYLQLTHANRYDSPLRAVLASGSFIEGWAVYSEAMMVEAGFLDHDPLMRLSQLKWELRAIGNAILDQAVQVDGMSQEAAVRFMTHDTFQQEREATAKWQRAQLTAAQLPTYFIGAQEHLALREEVRKVWGKGFTLKRYHDAVLAYGSPPVRYARELVLNLPIE